MQGDVHEAGRESWQVESYELLTALTWFEDGFMYLGEPFADRISNEPGCCIIYRGENPRVVQFGAAPTPYHVGGCI